MRYPINAKISPQGSYSLRFFPFTQLLRCSECVALVGFDAVRKRRRNER